jgi:hypothetical protein
VLRVPTVRLAYIAAYTKPHREADKSRTGIHVQLHHMNSVNIQHSLRIPGLSCDTARDLATALSCQGSSLHLSPYYPFIHSQARGHDLRLLSSAPVWHLGWSVLVANLVQHIQFQFQFQFQYPPSD